MRAIYFLVFLGATLLTDSLHAEQMSTAVVSQGETLLDATAGNLAVKVKIKAHEIQIGKPTDARPISIESNCTYSKYPCSVVDQVNIAVNGNQIFVPRSAFCDLADLSRARISFEKNESVLSLEGGDASESYIVKIKFDAIRVKRRTLSSGTQPKKPLQETIYNVVVEGD
jgi:hypothetical protein